MASLTGTNLEFLYWSCGAENDVEFINFFSNLLIVFGIIIVFWNLCIGPLPYGKHSPKTSQFNWFPKISARRAWQIGLLPTLGIPLAMNTFTRCEKLDNYYNLLAFVLYVCHYINRVIIYPSQISNHANPVGWFFIFLAVGPGILALLQSHHLANVHLIQHHSATFLGLLLFFVGMSINIYHDRLLTSIRKQRTTSRTPIYKIPQGGLFKYVCCPNYLGEIVEWFGFALFTQGGPQVILAVFSLSMAGLRAFHHHEFYKNLFPETYPPNRKAIIPFLL